MESNYIFDDLKLYIDENGNPIKVIKVTNIKYGLTCVVEGIHEHKVRRKGIKKIQKQIKEQERTLRK